MGQYEEQLQALTQSPGDFEGPHLLKLELAMMEVRERLADLRSSDAWTGKAAELANERLTELSIECSQIEADVRAVRFALPDASTAVENARQAYHSLPSSWVPEWVRDAIDVAVDAGDALVRVPNLGTFAVGTALNEAQDILVTSRETAAREAITRLHQELEAPLARIDGVTHHNRGSEPGSSPTPKDDNSNTGGNGGGTGGPSPLPHFPGGTSPASTPTSPGSGPGYVPADVPLVANGTSAPGSDTSRGNQAGGEWQYTPDSGYSVDSNTPGYTYTPGAGSGIGTGTNALGSGYSPSGHYGGSNPGLTAGLMGAGAAGSAAAMRAGTVGFGTGQGATAGGTGITGRGGILGRMGAEGSAASARGTSGGGLAGGRAGGAGGLGPGGSASGSGTATTGASTAGAARGGGMVGGAPMGGAGSSGSSKKSAGTRSSGLIAPRVDEEEETMPLPSTARAGSREARVEDR